MSVAFILRRMFLIALLAVPQVYWLGRLWRLRMHFRCGFLARVIVRLIIAVVVVLIGAVLYDRIERKFIPSALSSRIAPPVQLWIFSSTFAFFLTKALHAVTWFVETIVRLVRKPYAPDSLDPTRRTMLHQVAAIAGATPFVVALYGYARERLAFEVNHVDIPVANLPYALGGLRIAHLSDIHVGDAMPLHKVRRAVDMANSLGADIAVITGDFVSSRGDLLAECIAELGHLRAPLGVWGCNGNHEIYAGAEDDAEALFSINGMRLLRQTAVQIKWNGTQFNLLGIDYQRNVTITQRSVDTLNGADSLVRTDMPNILLSHNPNTFYCAADAGVELSLGGHTHGGQVNVEILNTALNPARFFTNFIAGLYRLPMKPSLTGVPRQASLYVNRGLGTLGIPARIGAYPEIALLTLRRA